MAGAVLASGLVGSGCRSTTTRHDARLSARPSVTVTTAPAGTHPLRLRDGRDGILHLPHASDDGPLALIVLCHGAGGTGDEFFGYLAESVTSWRAAILAPDAAGSTWDAILAEQQTVADLITGGRRFVGFGPDVTFLDRALERVFATVAVDPMRIAIAGFSDGATYALSLGLINGDLFPRIVAFSPGFVVAGEAHGPPRDLRLARPGRPHPANRSRQQTHRSRTETTRVSRDLP